MFGTVKYIDRSNIDEEKEYEKSIIEIDTISPYQINREYLPVCLSNNLDYINNRDSGVYVLDGKALIENQEKDGLNYKFKAEYVQNAKLELPYIYYNGYTVEANGEQIDNYESENGFLAINLNEDAEITVKYTGNDIEKAGYVVSAITLIGIIIHYIFKKIKNRK